jgi:hypothetical protein
VHQAGAEQLKADGGVREVQQTTWKKCTSRIEVCTVKVRGAVIMMIRLPPAVLHGGQEVERSLCRFCLLLRFRTGRHDLLSDAHRRRDVPSRSLHGLSNCEGGWGMNDILCSHALRWSIVAVVTHISLVLEPPLWSSSHGRFSWQDDVVSLVRFMDCFALLRGEDSLFHQPPVAGNEYNDRPPSLF